jgi:hypothetical protein
MNSTKTRSFALKPAIAATATACACAIGGCSYHLGDDPASKTAGGDTLMLILENAGGPVGTVDRTELLVAYGKSRYISDHMTTLRAELAQAKDADDNKLAAEIEAEGPAWQEILHNQLAGTEPLYTIVLDIQNELRQVADEKGLSKIIEAGDDTDGIDITQDIAEALARSNP